MYFDLLYPFYAKYIRVDKMDRSLITARKHRLGSGGFQGGSRWGTGRSYNHHTWGPPAHPVSTGPAHAHMQPPPPYTCAMATSAGASSSMAPLPHRPGQANSAAQATCGQRPGSGMMGFLGRPLSATVVGPAWRSPFLDFKFTPAPTARGALRTSLSNARPDTRGCSESPAPVSTGKEQGFHRPGLATTSQLRQTPTEFPTSVITAFCPPTRREAAP